MDTPQSLSNHSELPHDEASVILVDAMVRDHAKDVTSMQLHEAAVTPALVVRTE